MSADSPLITRVSEAPVVDRTFGGHWGASYQILTEGMRERGGSLGVNRMCVPPGHATTPFHTHRHEDEVFFVLEGQGLLRYGDHVTRIRAGDCISCPAGTGIAHQLGNDSDADLVYLAIRRHDPDEICTYPDTGKVLVRSLSAVGRIAEAPYMDGEPAVPRIFSLTGPENGGT